MKESKLIEDIAKNCLSASLRSLNRMITASYDAALRPHGIKASQLNVLVAVASLGETTVQETSSLLQMDSSTFSRTLARLKKHGWLVVSPSGNGKIQLIEITEKGRKKITETYPDWKRVQSELAEKLGEHTIEALLTAGRQVMVPKAK